MVDESVEYFLWRQIENMNFNIHGYIGASRYLIEDSGLTIQEMIDIRDFAEMKALNLYDKLLDVKGVGDDGYSDLLWQIVANGEEFYNNITLEEAQNMINEDRYAESFAYSFNFLCEF